MRNPFKRQKAHPFVRILQEMEAEEQRVFHTLEYEIEQKLLSMPPEEALKLIHALQQGKSRKESLSS